MNLLLLLIILSGKKDISKNLSIKGKEINKIMKECHKNVIINFESFFYFS